MKRWMTIALALCAACVRADEIVVFSSASAGADAWVWSGARVKQDGDALVITEKNPEAAFGDTFLADRFPYIPEGVVSIDVADMAGRYTLQILAFKGAEYLKSLDLVMDSAMKGPQTFRLKDVALPPDTDHVTFKMWAGGLEGASVRLKDLRYVLPVASERILLDKVFDAMSAAEPEQVRWTPGENGATMTLAGEQEYGSVLLPDVVRKPAGGFIMLDLPEVSNCTVTAQLVIFDGNRDYLESKDALVRAGAGFNMARLDAVQWPAGAASFQIKLWLGGKPDCVARIRRIVVLE